MTDKLNYIGSSADYNWLMILFILSVSQWLVKGILLYIDHRNSRNIVDDTDYLRSKYGGFKRYLSFEGDTFYWFWNIFPVIFYSHFFYMEHSWNRWMLKIFLLDMNGGLKELYNIFFYSSAAYYLEISLIVIFALIAIYFGHFAQDKKHTKMIQEKEALYWWSKNFNAKIYFFRKLFLVTNLMLVAFLTYIITKITLFVMIILYDSEINVFLFHPDNFGGLYPIMEILSIVISMYFLRASLGIVGLDDHKGQGLAHKVGDFLNIVYLPFAILVFLGLIHRMKYHLEQSFAKYGIDEYLSSEKYQEFLNSFLTSNDKISVVIDFNHYYYIAEIPSFPVDISLFYNAIFTVVAPVSLWFMINNFRARKNA